MSGITPARYELRESHENTIRYFPLAPISEQLPERSTTAVRSTALGIYLKNKPSTGKYAVDVFR